MKVDTDFIAYALDMSSPCVRNGPGMRQYTDTVEEMARRLKKRLGRRFDAERFTLLAMGGI